MGGDLPSHFLNAFKINLTAMRNRRILELNTELNVFKKEA